MSEHDEKGIQAAAEIYLIMKGYLLEYRYQSRPLMAAIHMILKDIMEDAGKSKQEILRDLAMLEE